MYDGLVFHEAIVQKNFPGKIISNLGLNCSLFVPIYYSAGYDGGSMHRILGIGKKLTSPTNFIGSLFIGLLAGAIIAFSGIDQPAFQFANDGLANSPLNRSDLDASLSGRILVLIVHSISWVIALGIPWAIIKKGYVDSEIWIVPVFVCWGLSHGFIGFSGWLAFNNRDIFYQEAVEPTTELEVSQ